MERLEGEFSGQIAGNEDSEKCMASKQGGWTAFPFIIGSVLGLSLAGGGLSSNMIVYLMTKFNMKSINATQITNVVAGCINLFPIAGAIIADSFLGSFSVVTIFSFISLLGMILMTLTASINSLHPSPCLNALNTCEAPSNVQLAALFSGIVLASLGVGGTGFTVATMGADQFENPNDQSIFFNWYFIALYASCAISSTAIVYLQENVSWGLGFGVCFAANAIGLTVFIIGKRYYRHMKPKGSPFTSMARVIVAAIRKRNVAGCEDYFYGSVGMSKMNSAPTNSFSFLNNAALISEGNTKSAALIAKRSWNLCTVKELEDLKTLMKIIPLWSTSILLSTPIGVSNSLTVLQALTMDRHLGSNFQVPAASFIVFNIIATSVSLTILDRFLLPTWKKLTSHYPTPLQRLGIGHLISILGLVASALVEARRLQVVKAHNLAVDSGSVVPMSALWLVVPLIIMGIGEALHFPGQVAFYYQEFPTSLHTTSTAMMSLIIAIGLYLSTATIGLIRRGTEWLPDNINDGRVDFVFWILAGIGVVNFGYYLACAKLFNDHAAEKNGAHSATPMS